MKFSIVIPARYNSIRLPGKPLALIGTKPMIQRVYERAKMVRGASSVIIATDDKRIADAVKGFGGAVKMTSSMHKTGTERVAQAARDLNSEIIVNLQGDEPFIDPRSIEQSVAPLAKQDDFFISTLMYPIYEMDVLESRDVVKVITDREGFALYFSRQSIPHYREGFPGGRHPLGYKHIGLYAYRKSFLLKFAKLKPTPLEKAEKLEQLRALEYGYRIKVVKAPSDSFHVDTTGDLETARRILSGSRRNSGEGSLRPLTSGDPTTEGREDVLAGVQQNIARQDPFAERYHKGTAERQK